MQLVHSRAHVQLLFDGRLEDKLPVEEDSDKIANDSVSHLHWARNLLVRAQDRAPHSSGHPNRKCRNATETKERNLRLTHNPLSTQWMATLMDHPRVSKPRADSFLRLSLFRCARSS